MRLIQSIFVTGLFLWSAVAVAQNDEGATISATATTERKTELELKAEIARAEAEKAKAEAEKAKAEAEIEKARAAAKNEATDDTRDTGAAATANVTVNVPPPPAPVTPAPVAEKPEDEPEESQPNHRGFYMRFTPGLGLGTAWANGTMGPKHGIEAISDPKHAAFAGSLGLDLGAGIVKNLALHIGVVYEKMFVREKEPTRIAFSVLGVSAGLTWYFTDLELYFTGQFRWAGLLLKFPDVSCTEFFDDRYDWYKGPGLSFTLGREWYDSAEDDDAVGIGVQANYYRMRGGADSMGTSDNPETADSYYLTSDGADGKYTYNYFSLLIVLTMTHF